MNVTELNRIRVLFPDTFGFARGKYIPVAEATGELNFSRTVFGIGYDRDLIPAPGASVLEGMGDIRATTTVRATTAVATEEPTKIHQTHSVEPLPA